MFDAGECIEVDVPRYFFIIPRYIYNNSNKSLLICFNQNIEVMNINKNIAISDSGFIFNPSSGDSFSTNQVGLEIIRLLQEGKKKEDIISEVVKKYATDESTLEKDLGDFFLMLSSYQLLNDND